MSNYTDILKEYRNIIIVAGLFFIFYGLSETIINFKPLPGSYPYFRSIGGILLALGILLNLKPNNRLVWVLPVLVGLILFFIPVNQSPGIPEMKEQTPMPMLTTPASPVPTPSPFPTPIPTPIPTPKFNSIKVTDAFIPSGWIGDWKDISFDEASTDNPYSEPTCLKITYSATGSEGWAGIYWQYPNENWGNKPEGRNLTGATKLTFWVRGSYGGEKAEFKVGGTNGQYPDSIQPSISTGVIVLSNEWKQYTIDLTGKNLNHVISGFIWVTSKSQNPNGSNIFLDDIIYE